MGMDSDEELNKKTEAIEAIYKDALGRINALKNEQLKIIDGFVNALKEKRIAALKDLIISSQKAE